MCTACLSWCQRSTNTCRFHGDLSRCRSANRAGSAPLEIRAASWSLRAMTSTCTGGTVASFLIFSSLLDVSSPLKLFRIFLSTRLRTDSSFECGKPRPTRHLGCLYWWWGEGGTGRQGRNMEEAVFVSGNLGPQETTQTSQLHGYTKKTSRYTATHISKRTKSAGAVHKLISKRVIDLAPSLMSWFGPRWWWWLVVRSPFLLIPSSLTRLGPSP